ncbi:hypothetical protein ACFFJY_18485 [Fictibacillus aquaticus]|uniref:YtxH domain-containing protein n=1 Tax=Fictibacillus aquaticus TaxID=2021314 RepID=A0A235F5H3_9BACL|nr:hypothetical protein [Fictibacillus aquaticus]OYD56472.1 hypothetical protein CGZ90_15780 [Fictibacillus aquaticus]
MQPNYVNYQQDQSLLWKGIMAGALAGAALAMLDRETRNTVMHQFRQMGRRSAVIVNEVRSNPKETTLMLKERIQIAAASGKELMEDLKSASAHIEKIKQSGMEAVQNLKDTGMEIKEAGMELKEIGHKAGEAGHQIASGTTTTSAMPPAERKETLPGHSQGI